MRKLAIVAVLAILPGTVFAERLVLRDGSVVNGRFVSGSSDNIVFQDERGVRRQFSVSNIQSIDFNDNGPTTGPGYSNSNSSGDLNRRGPGDSRRAMSGSANRLDSSLEIPAGSQISVRSDQDINAETAVVGRTYPASIVQDVTGPSGDVVIPRGSPAQLVIRDVNESGTLNSGNLVLDLDSIQVNGRNYYVSTEDVKQGGDRGIGANRRTAEMVGGGAALGTLLGALAGGGKGAAIGAIAGAVAGGGVQVLTRGKEIRVPAETVLNFRLDQSLQLRESR